MATKQETITVATRISRTIYNTINENLKSTSYINMADYIRELIRRDVERMGWLRQK